MSNELAKADQIAHRCYSKLCLLVHDARGPAPGSGNSGKPDKWFNLETAEVDAYKEPLRVYRSLSSASAPPPLELEVLLAIPELSANEVLVHRAPGPGGARVRVEPAPRLVLLESWTLAFAPGRPAAARSGDDLTPAGMYKHGIAVFRAVYALLRVLPAWAVHRRLSRRSSLALVLRLRAEDAGSGQVLRFDRPLSPTAPALPTRTTSLPGVPHPGGTLRVSVRALEHPAGFALDELESLLSSRFASLDADFTPTLNRGTPRDSLASDPSTAALPPRAGVGLSTSPPSRVHVRTTSVSAALPAPAARLRKESTTSSSADLPASPGPLPIRRPQLNPLNPFKTSTLSSSPSLPSPSPSLRGGRPHASPTSSRASITASSLAAAGSIGAGAGPLPARQQASASVSTRPSPPVPTSAGLPASLGGSPGGSGGSKRYSSSFGHRRQHASTDTTAGGTRERRLSSTAAPRVPSPMSDPARSRTSPLPTPAPYEDTFDDDAYGDDADELAAFAAAVGAPQPLRRYRAAAADPHLDLASAAAGSGLSPRAHSSPLLSASPRAAGSPRLSASPRAQQLAFPRRPTHSRTSSAENANTGSPLRPPAPGSGSPRPAGNALGLGTDAEDDGGALGLVPASTAAIDAQLEAMGDRFAASLRALGGGGGHQRERTMSAAEPGPAYVAGGAFAGFRRADRISEVTEESSLAGTPGTHSRASTSSEAARHSRESSAATAGGPGSRADSTGSEGVLGRLDLGRERERR